MGLITVLCSVMGSAVASSADGIIIGGVYLKCYFFFLKPGIRGNPGLTGGETTEVFVDSERRVE